MRKQFVEVPLSLTRGVWSKAAAGIAGLLLAPAYLWVAWLKGAPGLRLHVRIVAVAGDVQSNSFLAG